ncbi:MAG: carboxypeptidase regulatory-like domain-containing protein, partial [Acidobacteriota bacterium]
MKTRIRTYLAVCLLAAASTVAHGQITGDLRGLVLDAQAGAVSQAKVTLKSLETGETRLGNASGTGVFHFNLLKIGRYDVRVEAAGFRTATAQVEVRTGEVAGLHFTLEVGQVSETVTVNDAVSPLDTETAQMQTSVIGERIQELPVGRNANLFALMAPGVVPVRSNSSLGSGSFNANGGRGRANNITVDGITTTDVSTTGTGGVLNPLNFSSIKEVKIITNNFSAEYGRNSTSQVLYVTKGGTNDLHGELFEYFRNDKLDARPFFDTTGKTNINRRNEYGWSVGGPLYIPKLVDGRNRVFWFSDYTGLKQRGEGSTRIARVPKPDMLAQVTDPTSRALLQQYQIPTSPTGLLETASPTISDFWQYSLRGDVIIGRNDTLWARYSDTASIDSSSGLTFIGSDLPGFGITAQAKPRQATLAETHTIGAFGVNEFRFGFGQADAYFPADTPYALGPKINFSSGEVTNFGQWDGQPQGREQRTFQFTDNFSFIHGAHNFKTGFEYYYLQADSVLDAAVRGVYTFPNWADFAQGRPATWQQRFGNTARENRVRNTFAFFQDDWKVKRNLTLNLGMRMEWAGGPTEVNGRISNLNLDNRNSYGAAGAGPLGLLEMGKPSFGSNTNWAPRLGFAWTPLGNQKTVVRGGYGIAYDFIFLNPITNQRFLPPLIFTGTLSGQALFTGANSFANFVGGTSALQTSTAAQVGQLPAASLNFGAVSPAISQDLPNPQTQQWNFGLQREQLGIVWKASYVGTKGSRLSRTRDINPVAQRVSPATSVADETARLAQFTGTFAGLNGNAARQSLRIDPRYNNVAYVEGSASSIYHGLQLEAQKRMSNFFLLAAYTWSKSIDDNSDVLGALSNDSGNQQDPFNHGNNRAASQFDLRQRLVLSFDWESPYFRHSKTALLKHALGGWGLSGITSFRGGFPVGLLAGGRRGVTDPISIYGAGAAVRPNVAGPLNVTFQPSQSAGAPSGTVNVDGVVPISAYANSLGLSQPLLGNIGTLGRNVVRINGESNFDLSLYKNFPLRES